MSTSLLITAGSFLGGLGLFLLAISMITSGLKIAAGDALRDILANSTRTRARGVASGILVTGVVQSSSAVTVATIGFVNAGLMGLTAALGVIYGANIGTTVTSWLVAAVGFKFQIQAFALPMVGIGMMMRLLGAHSRIGAVGEALAGFGLFFVGVSILQDGFAGAVERFDLAGLAVEGPLGVLLYVTIGAAITVLTQSSSAAIAITLTAATGGVLGLDAAAAMVIGASVGTTSTAAFAVIGATPNAKRVAAGHVLFNLVTASVAIVILPLMLWGVREAGETIGLQDTPAVTLALFHTAFKLLGLALFWPMTDALARFLDRRFRSQAETLGRLQYLDQNVAATPSLAVDALARELARALDIAHGNLRRALGSTLISPKDLAMGRDALGNLVPAIEDFIARLDRDRMSPAVSKQIPAALRITNYLDEIVQLTGEMVDRGHTLDALRGTPVGDEIAGFQRAAVAVINAAHPDRLGEQPAAELDAGYQDLHQSWHGLKDTLLTAAAEGRAPIARINLAIDVLRSGLRVTEQVVKAAHRLEGIRTALGQDTGQPPSDTVPEDPAAAA
ncbi:MAG: Na/Pi cotransporter family protein [Gammaproteobacteria bacterium]|nr:Na/Pi cotransporter family protein [Gammaproteobacteria bacterium]